MSVKTLPAEKYLDSLFEQGIESITSAELPLESDFEYVMSMQIFMECESSLKYAIKLLCGTITQGRYTVPNFIITKK